MSKYDFENGVSMAHVRTNVIGAMSDHLDRLDADVIEAERDISGLNTRVTALEVGGGGSGDYTLTAAAMESLIEDGLGNVDATVSGGKLVLTANVTGGGAYDDTALRNRVTAVENENDSQGADIETLGTRVDALEAGGGTGGDGATITSATLQYPWHATSGDNASADTTTLETSSIMNCGTAGHNITLPKVTDVPDQVIRYVTAQHACTVTCHPDDNIWMPRPGSDAKSINLAAGECVALVSYHAYNGWGRLFKTTV